jgi:hypothetical protein
MSLSGSQEMIGSRRSATRKRVNCTMALIVSDSCSEHGDQSALSVVGIASPDHVIS